MIPPRWKTSFTLIADRTRGSSAERRGSAGAVAEHHIPNPQRAVPGMDIGDIAVFDHHRRQIGFIRAPERGRDEWMFTREGQMSHCMNAPLSLFDLEGGDVPGTAGSWRRIPLLDSEKEICGVVVYDAVPAHPREGHASIRAIVPTTR